MLVADEIHNKYVALSLFLPLTTFNLLFSSYLQNNSFTIHYRIQEITQKNYS
jgi:predicted 2-oxoglutarate/Fe(II)-dependent dioxygenase YbiX